MFGFHVPSGHLMVLPSRGGLLKEFPQFCTRGSYSRPDLISELTQIIPKLARPELVKSNVPLFYPMKFQSGNLSPVNLSDQESSFCLVCYPDPERPPRDHSLVKEYWSLIQPMIICRDVSGYYLASPGDGNMVFFKRSQQPGDAWISKAISNYDESLSYGGPIFSKDKIHLVRDQTTKS